MTEALITLNMSDFLVLVEFIESHESDIANNINDYGDLRALFIEIFEREPEC